MVRETEIWEAELLERCLRRLEDGADLETCLREIPEAASLRPLLEAALWVRRGQQVALSPAAREQLIRQGQAWTAQRQAARRAVPMFRWALALAAFAGLLLGILGLAAAAEASLPDAPLYPLKRAVEAALAASMPPEERALWLAERRWSEFEGAAARGRWFPAVAEESLQHLEEIAPRLSEGAPAWRGRAQALYRRQGAFLEQALRAAPPALQAALAHARVRWDGLSPHFVPSGGDAETGPPTPVASPPLTLTPEPTREMRGSPPTPSGGEKRETPRPKHTPPGQEKRQTPRAPPGLQDRTPPGRESKPPPGPKATPPGRQK
ncbi:MAG: hypothetical protein C4313_02055 [Thermoflexus sp.]|uniref:hypothetical protein n=1 Tax=Thermoflexus sp. TaxID=1969742 RepID=UPI00331D281E